MVDCERERMTSTLERAIDTMSMIKQNLEEITVSNCDKEKVTWIKFLLNTQQASLISYVEIIRHQRRQARKNQKRNAQEKKRMYEYLFQKNNNAMQ